MTKYTVTGYPIKLAHDITQKRKHNETFFCSELVALAFEKAGIPLFNQPSHAVSPKAIAYSDKLTLIEELIA